MVKKTITLPERKIHLFKGYSIVEKERATSSKNLEWSNHYQKTVLALPKYSTTRSDKSLKGIRYHLKEVLQALQTF